MVHYLAGATLRRLARFWPPHLHPYGPIRCGAGVLLLRRSTLTNHYDNVTRRGAADELGGTLPVYWLARFRYSSGCHEKAPAPSART